MTGHWSSFECSMAGPVCCFHQIASRSEPSALFLLFFLHLSHLYRVSSATITGCPIVPYPLLLAFAVCTSHSYQSAAPSYIKSSPRGGTRKLTQSSPCTCLSHPHFCGDISGSDRQLPDMGQSIHYISCCTRCMC